MPWYGHLVLGVMRLGHFFFAGTFFSITGWSKPGQICNKILLGHSLLISDVTASSVRQYYTAHVSKHVYPLISPMKFSLLALSFIFSGCVSFPSNSGVSGISTPMYVLWCRLGETFRF